MSSDEPIMFIDHPAPKLAPAIEPTDTVDVEAEPILKAPQHKRTPKPPADRYQPFAW